jgi:5-methylcytosine-specific restriction endonuclease McrA
MSEPMIVCIDCPSLIPQGTGSRRCLPCRQANNKRRNHTPEAKARRRGAPQGGRKLVGACACCGWYGPMTRDHIIPLVRGGTSDPRNIQLLCRPCNSSKGATEGCHLEHGAPASPGVEERTQW